MEPIEHVEIRIEIKISRVKSSGSEKSAKIPINIVEFSSRSAIYRCRYSKIVSQTK